MVVILFVKKLYQIFLAFFVFWMGFHLFCDQRFEFVFDRVFISSILQQLCHLGPFLTFQKDMSNQDKLFLEFPFVFAFIWVKVIQPSFSALLGSSEVVSGRTDIELFCELAPFRFAIFVANQRLKDIILFLSPFFGCDWLLVKTDGLIFEEDGLLVGKNGAEVFPVFLSLNY